MYKTTAKALFLGMLAMAVLAAPVSAEGTEQAEPEGPCDLVEIMTFHPYVAIHPECIDLPPYP